MDNAIYEDNEAVKTGYQDLPYTNRQETTSRNQTPPVKAIGPTLGEITSPVRSVMMLDYIKYVGYDDFKCKADVFKF